MMEADKGGRKGLGRGKEVVESLIAGRKEGKKPKKKSKLEENQTCRIRLNLARIPGSRF